MLEPTLRSVLEHRCLIVQLCTSGLSGVELATTILVAMGLRATTKRIEATRQGRHRAIKKLVDEGWIVKSDSGLSIAPQLTRLSKGQADKILQNGATVIAPVLECKRPPAFEWASLSAAEQNWLERNLRSAVALTLAARFRLAPGEVLADLSFTERYAKEDCVFAFARILKGLGTSNAIRQLRNPQEVVIAVLECRIPGLAAVRNPAAVLVEWLANSPLAAELQHTADPVDSATESGAPAAVGATVTHVSCTEEGPVGKGQGVPAGEGRPEVVAVNLPQVASEPVAEVPASSNPPAPENPEPTSNEVKPAFPEAPGTTVVDNGEQPKLTP